MTRVIEQEFDDLQLRDTALTTELITRAGLTPNSAM